MPTAAKAADNMTKHLTRTEREAREQAEEGVLPDRGRKPELKKPAIVRANKRANAYWNQILKQMEGVVLLDDLDATVLAGYCSMLARRDQTTLLIAQLMDKLGVQGAVEDGAKRRKKDADLSDREWEESAKGAQVLSPDELVEAAAKLDALTGKLQALERNILQYAEKLGLTPSGRVRLAQRRAKAAAEEPDDDLFGD
ncbi:MAG: P27 family phage terminase small subunit [Oscillospiraceae bacterium]|jgi:P27 family predicted phage terminase small subunit|nr:P27 family phage terminase small subunit [Oscillospiraceae bacterium]